MLNAVRSWTHNTVNVKKFSGTSQNYHVYIEEKEQKYKICMHAVKKNDDIKMQCNNVAVA